MTRTVTEDSDRICNEFVFGAICPPAVTLLFTGVTCANGVRMTRLRTGPNHPSRGGARRIVKLNENDVVHELEEMSRVLVTRRSPSRSLPEAASSNFPPVRQTRIMNMTTPSYLTHSPPPTSFHPQRSGTALPPNLLFLPSYDNDLCGFSP